jgi:tetratricopeptide (TPR) repeat protein
MDALQGLLAHHQGDDAAAVTLCRRALEQAQTVEAVAEEAAALLYLGHALTSLHDLVAAADAYRAAASILQEGSPHRLAEARAGTALVLLRQGQKDAALVVVEELLPHLEEHPWLPGTDEPLRVWWVCWEVFQHHADPRASAILEHAYRLLRERAEQVLEGRRTSFLALPVHRAIQTSWNAIEGNNDAGSAFREATYHL